jgi:pyruvate ferredoxin oxidoreductase beta subunit
MKSATPTFPSASPLKSISRLQGRFRHLFEPTRQDEAIRHIQQRVDTYWKQVSG